MASAEKRKQKKIIVIILCLILCIAGTTFIFMDRIRTFLPNDEGAISLTPEEGGEGEIVEEDGIGESIGTDSGEGSSQSVTGESEGTSSEETGSSEYVSTSSPVVYHPGFEASDGDQGWGMNTAVEIFHISYADDGSEEITVKSNNGENLIAPGSENSYTFKLKNTGDVAMDYVLTVDAYITPADIHVPVEARISRHDQTWITDEEFEAIPEVNGTTDSYTLGAGRYSAYTLDWVWPYESGNDEWDTFLGNEAVNQDIVLTIKINTVATANVDGGYIGGMIPQTGDAANTMLYLTLMLSALLIMILLLFYREKEEGEQYE